MILGRRLPPAKTSVAAFGVAEKIPDADLKVSLLLVMQALFTEPREDTEHSLCDESKEQEAASFWV